MRFKNLLFLFFLTFPLFQRCKNPDNKNTGEAFVKEKQDSLSESLKLEKIDSTGNIFWTFKTLKNPVEFSIESSFNGEDWNEGHTITINTDTLQKNNSDYFSLKEHRWFDFENTKYRIRSKNFSKNVVSNELTINYKTPWAYGDALGDEETLTLRYNTQYTIYDEYGKIIIKGEGNSISLKKLKKESYYYIDAANFRGEFIYMHRHPK